MTTRCSLRSAVNAKCKACIYDPFIKGHGGWREQVANCGGVNCELYPVRPQPRERKTDGEA